MYCTKFTLELFDIAQVELNMPWFRRRLPLPQRQVFDNRVSLVFSPVLVVCFVLASLLLDIVPTHSIV